MVIFPSGNLYSFCSRKPGLSENYTLLIFFQSKKFEIDNSKVVFLFELVVIINES